MRQFLLLSVVIVGCGLGESTSRRTVSSSVALIPLTVVTVGPLDTDIGEGSAPIETLGVLDDGRVLRVVRQQGAKTVHQVCPASSSSGALRNTLRFEAQSSTGSAGITGRPTRPGTDSPRFYYLSNDAECVEVPPSPMTGTTEAPRSRVATVLSWLRRESHQACDDLPMTLEVHIRADECLASVRAASTALDEWLCVDCATAAR